MKTKGVARILIVASISFISGEAHARQDARFRKPSAAGIIGRLRRIVAHTMREQHLRYPIRCIAGVGSLEGAKS